MVGPVAVEVEVGKAEVGCRLEEGIPRRHREPRGIDGLGLTIDTIRKTVEGLVETLEVSCQ